MRVLYSDLFLELILVPGTSCMMTTSDNNVVTYCALDGMSEA